MKKKAIKAFIFDLGNTLIEYPSPDKLKEARLKSAKEIKIPKKLFERVKEVYSIDRKNGFNNFDEATFEKAFTMVLKEGKYKFTDKEIPKMLEEIYNFGFGKHASLVKGALELLEFLKENKMKMGIVSNTPLSGLFFKKEMERFGIAKYFKVFVWSSEFSKRKPSPSIFKKALNELGVKASEAVYVGDKLDRDVAGSRGVGMQSIWFDRSGDGKDHDGYRITSLTDISSFKELFV